MTFVAPRAWRNERGVAFAMAAVLAAATVGLASLGLGTGLLFLVQTEAQNASDAGAIAGAEALFAGRSVNTEAADAIKLNALTRGSDTPGQAYASDANIVSVLTGNFDGSSFQSGVPPQNAVEAIVSSTVLPLLRGSTTSTVSTRSVAAISGDCESPATPARLPIIVGECRLPAPDTCFDDSCMPLIRSAGANEPQVKWTSLFSAPSSSTVRALLPTSPGCPAFCGAANGASGVDLFVGDFIGMYDPGDAGGGAGGSTPSIDTRLLTCVDRCLVDQGITRVEVPVARCEFTGSPVEIVGFATFDIVSIQPNGAAPNPGMDIQGVVTPPDQTGGGCDFFGTGTITLVQ